LAVAKERGKASLDEITQAAELERRKERIAFFSRQFVGAGASIAGVMLAEDSSKVADAANFMVSLEQQNQDLAIRAMKVILEGDHLRIGELDPAIAAVVERFTSLVSEMSGRFTPASLTATTSHAALTAQAEPAAMPTQGGSPEPTARADAANGKHAVAEEQP
jgi:hypothetical protein